MACLYVVETQPVDAVLVVPSFRHPFDKDLVPFEARVEMCRLAMAPLGPRVVVSDVEAELGEARVRTLTMLEELARREPGAGLRLVIGADLLAERERWWRWPDVERLAPPLVIGRSGYPLPAEVGPTPELPAVSSSDIRARLAAGLAIDALVPRSVARFIAERGLYAR